MIRGREEDALQRMPKEISHESNILNESSDSEDSIFGPENDIMVSPVSDKSYKELNSDRKQKPR